MASATGWAMRSAKTGSRSIRFQTRTLLGLPEALQYLVGHSSIEHVRHDGETVPSDPFDNIGERRVVEGDARREDRHAQAFLSTEAHLRSWSSRRWANKA
jgi:hypothetical protein